MKRHRMMGSAGLAVGVAVLLILSGLPMKGTSEQTRGEQVILVVGEMDHMKTRNPLPATADDVWTHDVLDRVYDTVGKALPETDELVPYILKGVDVDGDGFFEIDEYGKFEKADGVDQLNITAYYDFNGVYFHDGVQATPGDLFFSYQLQAMNPRMRVDLLALMNKAGRAGSNNTATRWLFVTPAIKNWQNESTYGNSSLRFAVRFQLQEPFALFYRSTLAGCVLYPRHVWEGTGWREDVAAGGKVSPLHPDFGQAIYPESDSRFGQGIPTAETTYRPFVYLKSDTPDADSAEEWRLVDEDVIGTGPFSFDEYNETTRRAQVLKNRLFFAGFDARTGVVLDAFVRTYIHQPFIDGITFMVVQSDSLCLQYMETWRPYVDYCHLSIPPVFLMNIVGNWDVRVWTRPDPGFTYVGYNLRRPAVGKWHWGQPDEFDVGYHFRKAVAHLIDKGGIVRFRLGGYGVPGIVPVSPSNKHFYNTSLLPYEYNSTLAQQELDLAHADAVWLSSNGGPPEASAWYTKDPTSGKIIMPGIGTDVFHIWCKVGIIAIWGDDDCEAIAGEMWKLGFNVSLRPSTFEGITNQVTMHDFDMYILYQRIDDDDPDYLYDLFHSSNAQAGANYVGFNDPLMDRVLDDSRREMNESRRVKLLKWAQGIIADKMPYDTLYFRTKIEATRQDRFIGWRPLHGTIWNFWSLLNVRPPSNTRLHVTFESQSAVEAGGTATLVIRVKDSAGEAVDGAEIQLAMTPEWAGGFSYGGGPPENNLTAIASSGELRVTYIAPDTDMILNVTITATARLLDLPEIPEASGGRLITIYPVGERFLAVTLQLLDSDLVASSSSIRFAIDVKDHLGFPMQSALVNTTIVPEVDPPYGLFPTEGNATFMRTVTFRAPPANQLAQNESLFIMTVNATAPGFHAGSSRAGFIVVKLFRTCPDGSHLPIDSVCPEQSSIAPLIAAAFAGLVAVAAVSVLLRKRER